jgi:predicted phage-related endonuclease
MSQDSEKMKALLAFKKRLEERIENLDSELKEHQTTLELVNSILLEKGFKRGEMQEVTVQPEEAAPPVKASVAVEEKTVQRTAETESVIPLKTMNEEPLAIIYVEKQTMHVLPDESKSFNVNTQPFSHFLVERVLAKMQEKDNELVRMGQLTPDKMFAYNIIREGDLLREIVIKNIDEERLRELKSSIRWTLEKMYEKMKSQT